MVGLQHNSQKFEVAKSCKFIIRENLYPRKFPRIGYSFIVTECDVTC